MKHLSSAGEALAIDLEALVLFPYDDADGIALSLVAGIWRRPDGSKCRGTPTIGVGHVVGPTEAAEMAGGISRERAIEILHADMADAEAGVNRSVLVELNEHQFDALCLFAFNVGVGGFAGSSLCKAVNGRRWPECTACFMMWVKTTIAGKLVVSEGLKRRRAKEAALFMTPMPAEAIDADAVMALVAKTADQYLADEFTRRLDDDAPDTERSA